MQKNDDIEIDDGYGPDQEIERTVEAYINKKLKLDRWEESGGQFAGCLGECAAVIQTNGQYTADLYIWDVDFNDTDLIVKWFYEAGAAFVNTVSAVLYDGVNGDRNGKTTIDGVKQWIVEFQVKDGSVEFAANTAKPLTDSELVSAKYRRDYDNRYWAAKKLHYKI